MLKKKKTGLRIRAKYVIYKKKSKNVHLFLDLRENLKTDRYMCRYSYLYKDIVVTKG